jgi:uncharacterized protein DUF5655
MPKASGTHSVEEHFTGKEPVARQIYDRLLAAVREFGPVEEDPKKTSIHLNRTSALAGVAVRKAHLVLTIKSNSAIASPRIHKSEQVSARRFHHELKLSSPKEIDKELRGWLKAAYELSE